jgi:hypothetical protein
MLTLAQLNAADGRLAAPWEPTGADTLNFQNGRLLSGRKLGLTLPLPRDGCAAVRVLIDLTCDGPASVGLTHFTTSLSLKLGLAGHGHQLSHDMAALAQTTRDVTDPAGEYQVEFELVGSRCRATVNGQIVLDAHTLRGAPLLGDLDFTFWLHCGVRRIEVRYDPMVSGSPALPLPPRRRPMFLEVCVDFPDDLMHAPFDRRMLRDYLAELASWGTRRIHWIDYAPLSEGLWDFSELNAGKNGHETVRRLGQEIFPAAVQVAHELGLEIYALIKPFDVGFWCSLPPGGEAAERDGRLPRVGGPVAWVAHFIARHTDLLMARKPGVHGQATTRPFTRIDLVKDDDAPAGFKIEDLRLLVSDDNTTYRPYEGPMRRRETVEAYPVWEHTSSGGRPSGQSRRARVWRLEDLRLDSPYFVLEAPTGARSFANSLINLVHVFSDQGEERRLTYSQVPRTTDADEVPEGAGTRRMYDIDPDRRPYQRLGFEFDRVDHTPTSIFPGYDAISAPAWLDGAEGLLAVARGKDRTTLATLSPSFPQARQWWLNWIERCLRDGADGIELRDRNHHSPYAWGEFGFEQPVRDAFLARHGVDLWQTDDFDHEAWRRLRGEGYSQFLREARALTRRHGRPLGIHLDRGHDMPPSHGSPMNVHMDWRTWVSEHLADSFTLKEVPAGSPLAREAMALGARHGIDWIDCQFANTLWRGGGGAAVIEHRIERARAAGCAGFQFFEAASVVRATPDGRIVMEQPALREVFRRQFAGSTTPAGAAT